MRVGARNDGQMGQLQKSNIKLNLDIHYIDEYNDNYFSSFYDVLHTFNDKYVILDIDEYIVVRKNKY